MKLFLRNRTPFAISTGLLITLTFLAVVPAFLAADETTDKVDKLFVAWDKTTTPGAALAVIKDGKIIYERGYGMARLEDGIVNTPDKVALPDYGFNADFTRGKDGRISGFMVNAGRAAGIAFIRDLR